MLGLSSLTIDDYYERDIGRSYRPILDFNFHCDGCVNLFHKGHIDGWN